MVPVPFVKSRERSEMKRLCLLFFAAVVLLRVGPCLSLLYYHDVGDGYPVTYDNRSFIVDGKRTLLLSGSVHYPRSTPGMWDTIFQEMVADGLNMVETYIFWNLHEFKRGQVYDFSGNANWTLFVEKAAQAGLFVNLRIGPYVCAEWNYGGLPVWLNYIADLELRASNGPWESEMARFVKDMAELAEPYLAKNGGPIIMAQIENEFRWNDTAYIKWCGDLVASLDLGIPWVMCNGESATNTINTCNGNDCTPYAEAHATLFPGQPLAWTEDEGWYQEWDVVPLQSRDNRTPEDISFAIIKWFARGGSHHNYYMWYGGNHIGRWAGASITNKYADGVNLHSDGLRNEPKKTHLQRLHLLLSKYASVLLNCSSQIDKQHVVLVLNTSSGEYVNATDQYAFVYQPGGKGEGLAFIENIANVTAQVKFANNTYTLPALSSSLVDLPSAAEVYNSGKVNSTGLPTQRTYTTILGNLMWKAWQEEVSSLKGGFMATHPLEQLGFTHDETDYLFYQAAITAEISETVNVTINSHKANAFLAFLDGLFQTSTYDNEHRPGEAILSVELHITAAGTHQLTLLSVNLGNANFWGPGYFVVKGITGSVVLGSKDITERKWLHRAKLTGEIYQVYTSEGTKSVIWDSDWEKYTRQSLVWYQTSFPAVNVTKTESLLLDLAGMGRGHIYLNGMDLGRYWLTKVDDVVVQRYYFIPPDILQGSNLLTLIEELGAPNPGQVALVTSTMVVP